MKQLLLKLLQSIFSLLPKSIAKRVITHLATLFRVNLLNLAYSKVGILNYRNLEESGEAYLIQFVLKEYLKVNSVFFDVGANVGGYARQLSTHFCNATIYSFEPSYITYLELSKNIHELDNVKCFNLGLSSHARDAKIYSRKAEATSTMATLHSGIIDQEDVCEIPVSLTTLDSFCEENNIDTIDFLKIDTEGHEFEVLKGAKRLLRERKVGLIQFEFNEMHSVTRVFLKDFYNLLPEYNFYRLLPNGLLSLNPYRTQYEVFQFQNILCVNKDIDRENKHLRFV